jgi:hypothetical protein
MRYAYYFVWCWHAAEPWTGSFRAACVVCKRGVATQTIEAALVDAHRPDLLLDLLYRHFLCCIPPAVAKHLSLVRHLS